MAGVQRALGTHQPDAVEERRIRLRRARYQWGDCWLSNGRVWEHYSDLYNTNHGGWARLWGDDIKGNFGDGKYHIGSTLDNVR